MMRLILDTNKGQIELGENTLVFALDDTGHEEFKDRDYQIYGIGGCAFLVKDYQRLIEIPFNYTCSKYFPDLKRPFHTTDVIRTITKEQIEALNHLFQKFMFFRIANIITSKTDNRADIENIRLTTGTIVNSIKTISEQAEFDRIFVICEDSERTGVKVMNGLFGYKISNGVKTFDIELGLMPKKSCSPALEIADLIIHTAGRQTRHRLSGKTKFLPDFESVFKSIDNRLISFMELTRVVDK
ncbi:hypothetical protein FLAV_00887 [Flavobacteriales bacterium]|nr:hypothetical protein FLAV_00887 [Flavobacteriales bacterium]